jgi:hypothetical protein
VHPSFLPPLCLALAQENRSRAHHMAGGWRQLEEPALEVQQVGGLGGALESRPAFQPPPSYLTALCKEEIRAQRVCSTFGVTQVVSALGYRLRSHCILRRAQLVKCPAGPAACTDFVWLSHPHPV